MVDGLADIRRITEERIEVFPVRTPAFADLRIFREDAVYRIREALQTVHTGNQDVLKAPLFQLRQHA